MRSLERSCMLASKCICESTGKLAVLMALGRSLSFLVVGMLVVCSAQADVKEGKQPDNCSLSDMYTIRLTNVKNNTNCSSVVEGRVQVCDGKVWTNLCDVDGNWTQVDAAIACKSLNYSSQSAQNKQSKQSAGKSTNYSVSCDGSEETFADCPRINLGLKLRMQCGLATLVVCYLRDEDAEAQRCLPLTTDLSPSLSTTGSIAVTATSSISSPLPTDPAPGTTDSTTQTNLPDVTDSTSFLTAPTLYYFIGGLSAIIVAVILLVVVFLLTCCCCCKRRKDVSPAGQQEKGTSQLRSMGDTVESQETKDQVTAHHKLQQSSQPSQPIYEAITSNESSSTHTQDSPSSKPLIPAATNLYASLDQNNTYVELEPHISSPCSATFSSSNSNYQQLDHRTGSRTGSMKRELPSRPIQAMNPTALAVDQGEVEERDLSAQAEVFAVGSSTSLPASTGQSSHRQQAPNGSIQQPHPEQVKLKELMESGDQTNVLDPPPDYSTLEQIDEVSQVSTTAVCNNGVTQGRHGSRSKEHSSPRSSHHSQERHPRSNTLPSNSISPRSSRTSSLSSNNSPQTNRTSRSPLTGRATVATRKISNKYSDDPTGSPRIISPNRHSGQSNGSDIIDTLV